MDLVRLRYIGRDRVHVPKLGRVVEPDDLVPVPRDTYERYGWPETLWRAEDDEKPARPARTSTAATAASKGE